ncbi:MULTISPECIES: ribonuclease E inhibitor RraB [Bacillus cereus group]|uniref:Regulator of ribonuclease activity B domain-containing protein n=1 Tax=Bacillus thuringiensis Bt18247 TaxID=1423143 RepID=A0A9W3SQL9_BACTU|nr:MULTISPECIES: ribonuclease E inhibitor RraB [Bacillus cereus group]AOM09791.1 hypothetical protein BTI247_13820 [Bacillus thuringiensis Bt18247]MED2877113.1 ribonuclease E inhibitor RraB [Bacillus thuringiensis]MYW22647.1 hypothetical protein [Bacillus thuringiensis]
MEFTFEKVQRIEDANIYRVSNITDIYETDLFDDYNRNVDNLSLLVQERINQFIVHNEEFEDWTCTCSKEMFLIYEDIVDMQKELNKLGEEFGGYTDGWGAFV